MTDELATVFYLGIEKKVPRHVSSLDEAKDVLGCPRDHILAFRCDFPKGIDGNADYGWAFMEDEDGYKVSSWNFRDGQHYRSFAPGQINWKGPGMSYVDSVVENLHGEADGEEGDFYEAHPYGCDCWVCRKLEKDPEIDQESDTRVGFGLEFELCIDDRQLDGLESQKVFLMGFEYGQVYSQMEIGFDGQRTVRHENLDRLFLLAIRKGFIGENSDSDCEEGWTLFKWSRP